MRNFTAAFGVAAIAIVLGSPAWGRPLMVAYVPNWADLKSMTETIDYDKLTHINIAFENPTDESGTLSFHRSEESLIARAHERKVKVLVSIGGGSAATDPALRKRYASLLDDDATRARFISGVVAYVLEHHFDGVDVDIEGPAIGRNYGAFVQGLAGALHGKGKLLTAAVAQEYGGKEVPDVALSNMDFVNVMAYDGAGPWDPKSPGQHSSMAYARSNIAYWVKRGVPREKLVLGIPFYGYGFGRAFRKHAYGYDEIVRAYPGAEAADQAGETIWYNGVATVTAKAKYVVDEGLGGVMIWSLDCDARGQASLLGAAYEGLTAAPAAKPGSR